MEMERIVDEQKEITQRLNLFRLVSWNCLIVGFESYPRVLVRSAHQANQTPHVGGGYRLRDGSLPISRGNYQPHIWPADSRRPFSAGLSALHSGCLSLSVLFGKIHSRAS